MTIQRYVNGLWRGGAGKWRPEQGRSLNPAMRVIHGGSSGLNHSSSVDIQIFANAFRDYLSRSIETLTNSGLPSHSESDMLWFIPYRAIKH